MIGELKGYAFEVWGEWLYFVPTITVDGLLDPLTLYLFIGADDRYNVSDDGTEITMDDGSPVQFGFSPPFGRFYESLGEAGNRIDKDYEVNVLPDLAEGDPLNLEVLIGKRFRFKQEVDEEGTKKFGKRVSGQGKNKKEYDRSNTVIDAVL